MGLQASGNMDPFGIVGLEQVGEVWFQIQKIEFIGWRERIVFLRESLVSSIKGKWIRNFLETVFLFEEELAGPTK